MLQSFKNVFQSMWLAVLWITLFMVHFFSVAMNNSLIDEFAIFDRIVYFSCFIIHGLLDTFHFETMTVIAFAVQFGFWWIVGIGLQNAFLLIRSRSAGKS